MTRAVVDDVRRLVPSAVINEMDVTFHEQRAEAAQIRVTPTIVVRSNDGAEVYRAEGVPTVNQVLVALAKAI